MANDLKVTVVRPVPEAKELVLVRLEGDLDSTASFDLENRLKALMQNPIKKLIFDLEQLSYMSSVGLGLFLGIMDELKTRGGELILVKLNEKSRRLFDMAGLLKFIKVFDTEAAALKSLKV